MLSDTLASKLSSQILVWLAECSVALQEALEGQPSWLKLQNNFVKEGSSFVRKKISLQEPSLQHFFYLAVEELVCAGSISVCFESQRCSVVLAFQSLALLPLQLTADLPGGEHCTGIC